MRPIRLQFILCLACLIALPAMLQGNDADSLGYLKAYLVSYPQNILHVASAPFDFDAGDWLVTAGVLATAGALYLIDEDIRDFAQDSRSDAGDIIAAGTRQFGDYRIALPTLAATAVLGASIDDDKTLETGLLGLESLILCSGATQMLKLATQRQRPYMEEGKGFWNSGDWTRHNDAFPSGHATVMWSLAPIIAHQYSEQKWVAPLAYSLATLGSLSRINDDKHWASDVFCGAVIGYLGAKTVLRNRPDISISANPQANGISVTYKF